MAVQESTYYAFSKVREMSPEAQDWAAVDHNWEALSKLIKSFENHHHTGVASMDYPGYNPGDPPNPVLPTLTESTSGGVLSPGSIIGVRLAYVDAGGLETAASPEESIEIAAAAARPLTPAEISIQPAANALPGGTYMYVLTKVKGSGETEMSDVLPVTVAYDQTYSVTLGFDDVDSYSDGTTAINIYRSTGLNSSFQLVTEITTTDQTQFTDINDIDPANVTRQPPTAATFDATRKVNIDWTAFTYPGAAEKLRVYVTQEFGLWGTEALLHEEDLTGSPADSVDYLGDETLSGGWPKESSQIPSQPALLDLTTEADGGVQASADSDFDGNKVANMTLGDAPTITKVDGMIWHDGTGDTIQVRLNGSDQQLAQSGASYAHPAESSGGHIADNIPFKAASGVSVKDALDSYLDTNGVRVQQQTAWRGIGAAVTNTTSATLVPLADMVVTLTSPGALEFNTQWVEIHFNAEVSCNTPLSTISAAIEIDSVTVDDSTRTWTAPSTVSGTFGISLLHALQVADAGTTHTIKVLWSTSGGTLTAVSTHRILFAKRLF